MARGSCGGKREEKGKTVGLSFLFPFLIGGFYYQCVLSARVSEVGWVQRSGLRIGGLLVLA